MAVVKLYSKESEGIWVHYGQCDDPATCRDTLFKVRRPDSPEVRKLVNKHRRVRHERDPKGQWQRIEETDDSFINEWIELFVLDWKNVLDEHDQPIPFSKDNLMKLLRSGEVVDFLMEVLRAANLDAYAVKEAELGN